MLHRNKNKQFGREKNQRNALIKTLAVSFIDKEKIKTTEVKAKVLKRFVEKIITKGKKSDLSTTRLIVSKVGTKSASKIIKELSPRYKDRNGGYTRVIKLQPRKSDGAKMAIVEFV